MTDLIVWLAVALADLLIILLAMGLGTLLGMLFPWPTPMFCACIAMFAAILILARVQGWGFP